MQPNLTIFTMIQTIFSQPDNHMFNLCASLYNTVTCTVTLNPGLKSQVLTSITILLPQAIFLDVNLHAVCCSQLVLWDYHGNHGPQGASEHRVGQTHHYLQQAKQNQIIHEHLFYVSPMKTDYMLINK